MNNMIGGVIKYLLILLLFMWVNVQAQYILRESAFSSGGGSSSSSNYILKDAIGQTMIGESKSSNYIEQAGFYTYSKIKYIGVEEQDEIQLTIPKVFSLSLPHPNPAGKEVTIRYGIPRVSKINIGVYDVTGRIIKELVNSQKKPGFHTIIWDGTSTSGVRVAQGVYFLRMIAPEFKSTKKVVILR